MAFCKIFVGSSAEEVSMKHCTWLRCIGNCRTDIFQLFFKKHGLGDSNFSFLHRRLQGWVCSGSVRAGSGTGSAPAAQRHEQSWDRDQLWLQGQGHPEAKLLSGLELPWVLWVVIRLTCWVKFHIIYSVLTLSNHLGSGFIFPWEVLLALCLSCGLFFPQCVWRAPFLHPYLSGPHGRFAGCQSAFNGKPWNLTSQKLKFFKVLWGENS